MLNAKTGAQNGNAYPYVEQRPDIANGKAIIVGTRIKITQIAIEYERLEWAPDQIVDSHPHLTLAQVHDALSYYYDHQPELDAELLAEEKEIAALRQRYPSKAGPCMPVKIYTDESVPVAAGLQRRYVEAISARDSENLGLTDEEQVDLGRKPLLHFRAKAATLA